MNDEAQKTPANVEDKTQQVPISNQETIGAGLKWSIYIGLPFVSQIIAAMFLNPLGVGWSERLLVDIFGMQLSTAQFLTDSACRILGVVVGIVIAKRLVRRLRAKSQKTNSES